MTLNADQTPRLTGSQVITGEGVTLEMPSASFASRIASGLIDYLLYAFIGFGAFELLLRNVWDMNMAHFQTLTRIIMATTFFMIPALVSYITRGSSLGKKIVGLRVVRGDGGTPSGRQHFVRGAVGVIEVWLTIGIIATITSMLSPRGSRLGDMVAGTHVVVWPKSTSWDRNVEVSPHLDSWFDSVLVRPIPAELHMNVTEFLAMRKKMSAQAREARARELAAAVESYCAPPPPQGTPAEEFLCAVVVARFEADEHRFGKTRQRHEHAFATTGSLPRW